MSTSAGMTVRPLRSTRAAPAGIATSPLRPTASKRAPRTTNAASSIGPLPSPTISRAPSYTVTSAWAAAGGVACSAASMTSATASVPVRFFSISHLPHTARVLYCVMNTPEIQPFPE